MNKSFELRHNDTPVLAVMLNDHFHFSDRIEILNKERVPYGLCRNGKVDIYDLDDWFSRRGIPEKREGVEYIKDKEDVHSMRELLVKNYGLSMNDHYWLAEENDSTTWAQVNYFDNTEHFKKDGDDIYIGALEEKVDQDRTVNSGASGMLPKKWIISNGSRYLLKGSETAFKQEPFNEKIASLFLDKMDIEHIDYKVMKYKDGVYSICPNMLDNRHELIHAYDVARLLPQEKNESNFEHYIRICRTIGIKDDVKMKSEQMIVADYVMANTDRHWSNFGIIRNAQTLQAEKIAPLYDNGASFYAKLHEKDIPFVDKNLKCLSFRKLQVDNLKLVKDFSWVLQDALKELPDIIRYVLNENEYTSGQRTDVIATTIQNRITVFNRKIGL